MTKLIKKLTTKKASSQSAKTDNNSSIQKIKNSLIKKYTLITSGIVAGVVIVAVVVSSILIGFDTNRASASDLQNDYMIGFIDSVEHISGKSKNKIKITAWATSLEDHDLTDFKLQACYKLSSGDGCRFLSEINASNAQKTLRPDINNFLINSLSNAQAKALPTLDKLKSQTNLEESFNDRKFGFVATIPSDNMIDQQIASNRYPGISINLIKDNRVVDTLGNSPTQILKGQAIKTNPAQSNQNNSTSNSSDIEFSKKSWLDSAVYDSGKIDVSFWLILQEVKVDLCYVIERNMPTVPNRCIPFAKDIRNQQGVDSRKDVISTVSSYRPDVFNYFKTNYPKFMESENMSISGGRWPVGTQATLEAPSKVVEAISNNIPVKIGATVYTQQNNRYLGLITNSPKYFDKITISNKYPSTVESSSPTKQSDASNQDNNSAINSLSYPEIGFNNQEVLTTTTAKKDGKLYYSDISVGNKKAKQIHTTTPDSSKYNQYAKAKIGNQFKLGNTTYTVHQVIETSNFMNGLIGPSKHNSLLSTLSGFMEGGAERDVVVIKMLLHSKEDSRVIQKTTTVIASA